MEDVTDEAREAADITVNIDTVSPGIPGPIQALGLGVNALHEESPLLVTDVHLDSGDRPHRFTIEGVINSQ